MAQVNTLQSSSKFLQNELVLCFEPDPAKAKMLYDAKILDIDVTKDEKGKKVSEYYVHFQGWNKSWDRWVLEDQLLKNNENSRTLQAKLYQAVVKPRKRKHQNSKSEQLEDDKSVASTASGEPEDFIKTCQLPRVAIDIPKVLANRLEDDCYNIKRNKKLIRLPRKPVVKDIFKEYFTHCQKEFESGKSQNQSLQIVEELLEGLHVYFNFYIGTLLLYQFEKDQYYTLFPSNKEESLKNKIAKSSGKQSSKYRHQNYVTPSKNNEKPISKTTKLKTICSTSSSNKVSVMPSDRCLRDRSSSMSLKKEDDQSAPPDDVGLEQEANTTIGNTAMMETRSSSRKTSQRLWQSSKTETSDNDEKQYTKNSLHSDDEHLDKDFGVTTRLRRSARKVTSHHEDESEEIDTLPIGSTAKTFHTAHIEKKENLEQLPLKSPIPLCTKAKSYIPFPHSIDNKMPSEVYGAEHLLRLFVKLPTLLSASHIEEPKIKLIVRHISLFLDYLANESKYFSETVHTEPVL